MLDHFFNIFLVCLCQYFSEAGLQSLTEKQKQMVILSLYYAANWIRELVSEVFDIISLWLAVMYNLVCILYLLHLA